MLIRRPTVHETCFGFLLLVSFVFSLVLTKILHHLFKGRDWAFVPELLAGVLRFTLICLAKEIKSSDWLSFRTLPRSRIQDHSLQTFSISTLSFPFHFSSTTFLLRKPFLAWVWEMKKGTPLSSNSQIFYLCLEFFTDFQKFRSWEPKPENSLCF